MDLPRRPVQRGFGVSAAGLHNCQRRPVLWRRRERLRIIGRLRNRMHEGRMDLPGRPVQGSAGGVPRPDLQAGRGRPVLRDGRRRLWQRASLRHGLHRLCANWVCGTNSVCVGGSDCVKVACNNSAGVQQYCGSIGDNCGGTLSCPTTCPSGTTCGLPSAHICGCGNLCLKQVACTGTATTSISGTVYDPAGLNPLYNVIVSIPNGPLDPITPGAGTSCPACDAQVSGQPIATALTASDGSFTLNNVPWGSISHWSCSLESGGAR